MFFLCLYFTEGLTWSELIQLTGANGQTIVTARAHFYRKAARFSRSEGYVRLSVKSRAEHDAEFIGYIRICTVRTTE